MSNSTLKYLVGAYLCIVSVLAVYGTYKYWPQETILITETVPENDGSSTDSLNVNQDIQVPHEASSTLSPDSAESNSGDSNDGDEPPKEVPKGTIVMLIVSVGVLGSMLHALNSFTAFIGNERFNRSWAPWYFLRPFIGALIALIFYLVLNGGLGEINKGSLGWIIAACALAGMFSDKATVKLKDIFDAIFPTDDKREGKLQKKDPKNESGE